MSQYKFNGNLFNTTSAISKPMRCSSTCKHRLVNGVQEQAASCQQLSHILCGLLMVVLPSFALIILESFHTFAWMLVKHQTSSLGMHTTGLQMPDKMPQPEWLNLRR